MPCMFCGQPKTTNEHVYPHWLDAQPDSRLATASP
jgi:hypothetical protein